MYLHLTLITLCPLLLISSPTDPWINRLETPVSQVHLALEGTLFGEFLPGGLFNFQNSIKGKFSFTNLAMMG